MGAVFAALLLFIDPYLIAAPPGHSVAAQHAARAKVLFDEGFYELLPHGNRTAAYAKFDLALHENQRAIELDRDFEPAYRQLARLYHVQKRYEEEVSVQREILRLRPGDVDVRVRLADTLTRLQRYGEALEQLQVAQAYTNEPHALRQIDRYIAIIQDYL
jgi:tetratricopeptide (TPR) repeat protein